ncbi:MAG: cupin domain-containing protein, partial [Dermatophilaceae bacterium]
RWCRQGRRRGSGQQRRLMLPADVLGELVGMPAERFAAEHWGRRDLLVSTAERDRFVGLFGVQAVDELVARRGLRVPFLRLAKDGESLHERAFTTGGGVGAGIGDQIDEDAVRREFAAGATIVLQGLHRTWSPIVEYAQALAGQLGHAVQVNAYVTPPGGRGFEDHYDVHDVFVLQIHGDKRWFVRDPVWPDPLRDQPWTDRRGAVDAAVARPARQEATLEPGDCWYLPRGYVHSAAGQDDVSIHVTVGVHVWTRHHLASVVWNRAREALALDPGLRGSLPMGVDVADPTVAQRELEAVRSALVSAVQTVSAQDVAAELQASARARQRSAPLGPLAQWSASRDLRPDDVLTVRPHLMASLEGDPEAPVVRSRAGRVAIPPASAAAVRRLLEVGSMTVADLMHDEQHACEVARRLVVAGVAVRRP